MGMESPQMEDKPVLPWACPLYPRLLPSLQRLCRGEWVGWVGKWGNQRSPEGSGGGGILPLSSVSCPQAEKVDDSILPNNGELAVRAKLVFPAGPRKFQEALEGRWPPVLRMCICYYVTVSKAWSSRWAEHSLSATH